MLMDRYKTKDELVTETGACRYCGQLAQVEVPATWDEDKINELVTEKCECCDAVEYAKMKNRKANAHEKIVLLFGGKSAMPVDDKAEELLHLAVEAAVEWDIEKISVDIKDGTKGKISRTAKGSIKIERSESKKNAYEL